MAGRHKLEAAETERGRRGSALVRGAAKNQFLWEVRDRLIELAKAGQLRRTLRERAEQLNALGVRTSTGRLLDSQKLAAALKALGAEVSIINQYILCAEKFSEKHCIDESYIFEQLWENWLYHYTKLMVDDGMIFGINKENYFKFSPIIPSKYKVEKLSPPERDSRVKRWWYGEPPVLPPQARLVFALFGMFGYSKQRSRDGRTVFP